MYPKGDKWIARIRWTDDDGRPQERTATAASEKAAKTRLKALQRAVEAGEPAPSKDPRLGEFIDMLLGTVFERKVRSSTLASYRGLARNHLGGIRDVRLSRLTPAMLEEHIHSRPTGERTRGLLRRFLVCCLNHGVRLGYVRENAARRTLPPRYKAKRIVALTIEEARAQLAACPNPAYRAAMFTQMRLGLRRGELLGIRWADVDFAARTVSISAQLQRDRISKTLDLVPLKTDRSERVLPLDDDVQEALLALAKAGPFAFASEVGGPIDPRNYARSVTDAAKRAGLRPIGTHVLRHSFCSWMIAAGVDVSVASRAMGHSSIAMTMQYVTTQVDVLRQANDKVRRMFA